MKTPEEFLREHRPSAYIEGCIWWNDLIRAIYQRDREQQAEGWRQGMTDAAALAHKWKRDFIVRPEIDDAHDFACKEVEQTILAARDAKGTTEQTQRKET